MNAIVVKGKKTSKRIGIFNNSKFVPEKAFHSLRDSDVYLKSKA